MAPLRPVPWDESMTPQRFVAGLPVDMREVFKRAVAGNPGLAKGMCDSYVFGEPDTMRLAEIRITGSSTELQPVSLSPIVCSDMLVTDVSYSLDQPNFPDSFWKWQRLAALTLVPGVAIQVEKYAVPGRILADWVPLQNWARPTVIPRGNNGCSNCWILRYCDQLRLSGRSTRTLAENENPTVVSITFAGMIFRRNVDLYNAEMSAKWLAERGFNSLTTGALPGAMPMRKGPSVRATRGDILRGAGP